jgi:Rieske 2Fe-2S family protein
VFSQVRGTPAPIDDPIGLALAAAPHGESRMLPRAAYVDPEVLAWERTNFFAGWTCLGRAEELSEPGMQHAYAAGAESVLVIRGDDRVLRGFANVCRHRGHELLPCGGSATKKAIVCPYHAWTYALDGSLRGAPGFRNSPGFDPTELGLAELPLVDWHGWLFVDSSNTAGAFGEHVGSLEDIVAPYAPEDLRVATSHSYEVAANWKVIIENYQECYHCSNIHPELCRVSPPDSGANVDLPGDWVGGWMDLRDGAATMSFDGQSHGTTITGLGEREQRTVMYVVVFPNLLISLHPDYVMTHHLRPISADRTHVECAWLFPAESLATPGFDPAYAVDFWDLTNRQDWAACESVQRGLTSLHAVPGPLAPDEDGVYQFVTRVARGYLGAG